MLKSVALNRHFLKLTVCLTNMNAFAIHSTFAYLATSTHSPVINSYLSLHTITRYFLCSFSLQTSQDQKVKQQTKPSNKGTIKSLQGELRDSYVCIARGTQVSSHHIFTLPRNTAMDLINK